MESSATSAHPLGSRFRGNERTGVTRSISAKLALIENPHALQIDDLPRLAQGEVHRVLIGAIGVGADETVLLAHAVELPLDGPRRLVVAVALERRRADDKALVFDRIGHLAGRRFSSNDAATTEKRHW